MKKTLAAAAVLGAFAGSALAADVTRFTALLTLVCSTPTPIRTRLPALPTSCRWLPVLKQVPVSA